MAGKKSKAKVPEKTKDVPEEVSPVSDSPSTPTREYAKSTRVLIKILYAIPVLILLGGIAMAVAIVVFIVSQKAPSKNMLKTSEQPTTTKITR